MKWFYFGWKNLGFCAKHINPIFVPKFLVSRWWNKLGFDYYELSNQRSQKKNLVPRMSEEWRNVLIWTNQNILILYKWQRKINTELGFEQLSKHSNSMRVSRSNFHFFCYKKKKSFKVEMRWTHQHSFFCRSSDSLNM